ncbi:LacI family transcriptional regulator [Streptomyces sp. NBC_01005]|uniref:LacI family DNA-binding transcriptional regulator n=1 Tax=unclassified Streptomyces TaxID=2593676 RepID=UPI002E30189B|nr:LacI family DNA-binding transcriptional regulator [Streptomyces sp. NBC_01362]WSW03037.1 LacI family transcriptional regulator [Streptomyces sp. NBC_01005]WTC92544.1 LacI family transcriptional regulator [Streptomyces sp. NBC_01650]
MPTAPRKARPTSTDVARLAGVSRTTVSYVLNGPGDRPINDDTRRRVMAAVHELGYAPHSTARTLRAGRSNIVLVPMPQLPLAPTRHRFLEELSGELAHHGLTMLVHGDREAGGVEGARAWAELRPAAVFTEADRCPAEAAELLGQAGVDTVLLYGPKAQAHAPTLVITSAGVAELATRHLLSRGHRRLACLVPGGDIAELARARFDAVTIVAGREGVPVQRVACELSTASLVPAVDSWRDPQQRPDALYAYNDEYALVLIQALTDAGLRVPHDMAVVGSDNLPLGSALRPRLTTTYLDLSPAAAAVAASIASLLRGDGLSPDITAATPKLLIRESA